MKQDKDVTLKNSVLIVSTMGDLGFNINYKKSVLKPTQRILISGYIIYSVEFQIFLPDEKIQKIKSKAQKLIKNFSVSI